MKKVESFRRCHVCGYTTHSEAPVHRCSKCNKAFAPFYYYNDFEKPIVSEFLERPPLANGEWQAIQGLTAHW